MLAWRSWSAGPGILAVCQFTLHQTVGNLWDPGPFHKPCLHCQIFYVAKRWRLESIIPVDGLAPGFVFPLESLYSHNVQYVVSQDGMAYGLCFGDSEMYDLVYYGEGWQFGRYIRVCYLHSV
jgi:hypothetical protein